MVGYLGNKTDVQMYVVLCVYAQSSAVISVSGGDYFCSPASKKNRCVILHVKFTYLKGEGGRRIVFTVR